MGGCCKEKSCKKQLSYGLPGEPSQYCATHKKDGMLNKRLRCLHVGCETHPSFGYKGQNAQYCVNHKLKDMEPVRSQRCVAEGCKVFPSFGLPGEKSIYCKTHKKEGMVSEKVRKLCAEEGCKKHPSFGNEGEDAKYCNAHKHVGMINVTSKRCAEDGCKTIPSYGFPGEKPVVCLLHRKQGMINLISKHCVYEGCMRTASHALLGDVATYCSLHANEEMQIVKKRYDLCKQEGCSTRTKSFHLKGYCLRCFVYNFPNEKIARGYKVKERHVTDAIKPFLEQLGVDAVFDRRIRDDCCQTSFRRPDVLIDMGTHSIIIEIDENQHEEYTCENKRIMEIFQDLGMRPLVVIRFNPDDYINSESLGVRSCFTYHRATGVPIISNSMKQKWSDRMKVLCGI